MTTYSTIYASVEGKVGTITLSRPEKRNAFSTKLFRELVSALSSWRADRDVAVVIIQGNETFFSAGLDLEVLDNPSEETRLDWYDATYRGYLELLEYPKATIAAVAGPVLGGGCDIAAFCDIRIAAENSTFGFPQVRFGLTPFVDPLWRLVGLGQTKLLTLTGMRIDAKEAFRIGLVERLVPDGKLLSTAREIAEMIAETGTDTVMRTVEMLRRTPSMDQLAAYVYAHVQYRDAHWNSAVGKRIASARRRIHERQ